MPKFGWCRFAEDKYGQLNRYHNLKFKMYHTVPLGTAVQRTIGRLAGDTSQAVIFRLRRGNGSYGAAAGKEYQDKYKYFVPSSINNAEGQHARDVFIAAVAAWQALNPAEKAAWRTLRARLGLKMSGYNLCIRKYMKANL